MNQLRETLSQYWLDIQGSLFPWLKEELGELTNLRAVYDKVQAKLAEAS